jgi:hypothetical protein
MRLRSTAENTLKAMIADWADISAQEKAQQIENYIETFRKTGKPAQPVAV